MSAFTQQQRLQSFLDKVLVDDGCWEWLASRQPTGYGQFRAKGTMDLAHRISYRIFRGPIPAGMFVCHTCDNRGCVRPSHLFLGTQSDNMQDAKGKGRTNKNPRFWGDNHPRATLTNEQVREIRLLISRGDEPMTNIARRYGTTPAVIYNIKSGASWSRVMV